MTLRFNAEQRVFKDVEAAAVFYAEQARRLQEDPSQQQVFQASCETAEMLLRLHKLEGTAMQRMKLGRKAIKTDSRTLRLSRYLSGSLPLPPASKDWTGGVTEWGAMLNDSLGDCTCAGVGHATQAFSLAVGDELTVTDVDVLAAYEAWCGYDPANPATDQGGILLDVLNDWKHAGFAGKALDAFASVTVGSTTEVEQAIALFGGLYGGMMVPNFIMDNVPDVWDAVEDDGGIDGGHCVFFCGYDQTGVFFISWGSVYKMTWAFWKAYVDEGYALVSEAFINAAGMTPGGFDLAALQADLVLIR